MDKEKELLFMVHYEKNPLMRIEIGFPQEVLQSRSLAREIVYPMMPRSEVGEIAVELIATVSMHCMYAHYADPEFYPFIPTLASISNFLKMGIIAEEVDEDNYIYDIRNRRKVYRYYPKKFCDVIVDLVNFQHVSDVDGIDVEYWSKTLNYGKCEYSTRIITSETLHEIYEEYFDVYEVNPYIHPWIYCNLLYFLSCKKTSMFKEALALAPLAIDKYVDEHLECSLHSIDAEYRRRREFFYGTDVKTDFLFKPDWNAVNVEDEIVVEKKGRRLKSLKEIIRQVFGK